MEKTMTNKQIKYKKFDSQRRFGVELEVGNEVKKKEVQAAIKTVSELDVYVSGYSLSSNNGYWHVKDDASCGKRGRAGPKGVEIASFIASGIKDIDHISSVAKKLQEVGCKVNQYCGLHIHAEAVDLNILQMASIVAHWIKIEHILSLSLPDNRIGNHYCQYVIDPDSFFSVKNGNVIARNKAYDPQTFWNIICPENISFYNNPERRMNLNLVNFARAKQAATLARGTVELRWPEGTLQDLDIRCWIRLFINFIENCKNRPMPKNLKSCDLREALELLGLHHDESNFFVLSKGLHETKSWFLNRILYFSKMQQRHELYCKKVLIDAYNFLQDMWSPLSRSRKCSKIYA